MNFVILGVGAALLSFLSLSWVIAGLRAGEIWLTACAAPRRTDQPLVFWAAAAFWMWMSLSTAVLSASFLGLLPEPLPPSAFVGERGPQGR